MRPKSLSIVVAITLLILSGVVGSLSGRFFRGETDERAVPGAPDLTVAGEQLTFVDVWEDGRYPLTLTIRNEGEREAVVEEFRPSCSCLEVDPKSLNIPAGGQQDVRLTLDLSTWRRSPPEVRRPTFEASLVAHSPGEGGAGRVWSWTIRGTVRPAIDVTASDVNLGRVSDRIPPDAVGHVEIQTRVPVERIELGNPSDDFEARVTRSATNPSRFHLAVSPRRGITRGEKAVDLRLSPIDRDGRALGGRTLPVKAWVVGDVQAASGGVIFGTRDVGTPLEEAVSLQSLAGRSCSAVDEIRCEGTGLTAEAVPSKLSGAVALTVRLRLAGAGPYRGKVSARVRMKDGSVDYSEFAVSAYGLVTK